MPSDRRSGFTLIELSIVLVIIGLIVGGVLVGQDLIRAAYVRAQISQIEKFNTAVNTFYGKYQALPGDMNATTAQAYGFAARGAGQGQGDGNGIIEGGTGWIAPGLSEGTGETTMFWSDLSYANGMNINLINQSFNSAQETGVNITTISGTQVGLYLPTATTGNGNYVYVWSSGGKNYWGLSAINSLGPDYQNVVSSSNIPVRTAYAIDSKIDDGLPITGQVVALYLNSAICFANVGAAYCAWEPPLGVGTALPYNFNTTGSVFTCMDNAGNWTVNPVVYSMSINNGAGGNCALSFKMQGGD
jgi:prepilin-type N-terminal cleavage/methylation domain-containing protein